MYIIAAILIFGVLIAVHELGHFLAAARERDESVWITIL